MDVLLPDPLTFGFKLLREGFESDSPDPVKESDLPESRASKSSVLAHEMTPMVVVVRNNTKDMIKINLNITCRDVSGENCVDGTKSTVLWTGNNLFLFAFFCNWKTFIWDSNIVY
jgi:hypothetical protein